MNTMLLAVALGAQVPLTLSEQIEICRTFHLVDQAKGKAMYDALPKPERLRIIPVCLTYRQGVVDARGR